MADFKRKLVAVFFTVVMLFATAAVTGCGSDDSGTKSSQTDKTKQTTPTKQTKKSGRQIPADLE
jgi:hypothetical protein